MDNSAKAEAEAASIASVLSFWFDHDEGLIKWFKASDRVDAECRKWTPLVEMAQQDKLTATWSQSANGTLALLILLDQLPRNIYRGTTQAYAAGNQALTVALEAIASGVDRQVELDRQMFFYLPLMHQESMLAQVGCLGLYQGMLARAEPGTPIHELLEGALAMAQVHVDREVWSVSWPEQGSGEAQYSGGDCISRGQRPTGFLNRMMDCSVV